MTQCERISKYMDDFGGITTMQAFTDLGVARLASRIAEMIQNGEKIRKIPQQSKNRYGETVRFVRYEKAV